MKKRLLSLLLAVCTAVSLLAGSAGAAPARQFADVTDGRTATNVEILRLMGVMDGYPDGTFQPSALLNRAQFCKMAVYAMDRQDELGLYRTVTLFPDVKPSHWAAPYINLCAKGIHVGGEEGAAVIAGFPDGRFHPEDTVTLGQAVTILLRVLGYQDSKIGGVWPDSFVAAGTVAGLLTTLPTDGYAPLTRAQAAQMFANLLSAKAFGGGNLHTLGETEVTLSSVDGGTGTVKVVGGEPMTMVHPTASTTLIGMTGRLVTNKSGKVLTFLPSTGTGIGSGAGAIVLYQDRSAAGLSELAGNSDYQLYKNGTPATVGDLRKYDVATYYPATNSILISDTRVRAYYEDVRPNPESPATVTALGTEFQVLPTAQESLSKLKPGKQLTLLLTADGKVAAASEDARGNALGYVDGKGKVQLFCGGTTLELTPAADAKYQNKVVRISSSQQSHPYSLSEAKGGVSGDLLVEEGKLGSKTLAPGALIYDSGLQISLQELDRGRIPRQQILYSHVNWAGEVDVVVLNRSSGESFGYVVRKTEHVPGDDESDPGYDRQLIKVVSASGETEFLPNGNALRNGDYVAYKLNGDKTAYTLLTALTGIRNVPKSAWMGDSLVQAGGHTYEVPANVQCYNRTTGKWIDLATARAYADTADLYVRDGFVRIVEVR